MKRSHAVILAVLLAAGALATIAFAAASSVSLKNPSYGVYKGKVSSGNDKCEANRKVTVRHDQNRNGYDRSDYKIGTDNTNGKGEYAVTGNQAPAGDQIAARVKKRTLGDGTVCKKATKTATAGAYMPPGV